MTPPWVSPRLCGYLDPTLLTPALPLAGTTCVTQGWWVPDLLSHCFSGSPPSESHTSNMPAFVRLSLHNMCILLNLDGPSLASTPALPCPPPHFHLYSTWVPKFPLKKENQSYTTLWLKTFLSGFATYRFQSPVLSKDLHVLGTFRLS